MDRSWRYEQDSRPRHGGENEDAVFCGPVCDGRLLFAAVADGVGGAPGGARAARRAIQLALRRAQGMRAADALDPGIWRMVLEELHGRLVREKDGSTTLSILATDGTRWAAAWVGDSRVYRVAGTGVECVSDTSEKTGYLGGESTLRPRSRGGEVRAGERLALLTDGLWKYVPGEAFRKGLAGEAGGVLSTLVAAVRSRNGGKLVDDASGVIVEGGSMGEVEPRAEDAMDDDDLVWVEEEAAEEHVHIEMTEDIAVIGEGIPIGDVLGPEAARKKKKTRRVPSLISAADRPIARLGLDPCASERLVDVLRARGGLIVMAGPAASGKTTLGYALCELLGRELAVVSVESPVERVLGGVTQLGCDLHEMAAYMRRAAERMDTEVIKGNIETLDGAEVMCQIAHSGRLAIGSMHANGAAAAVGRLTDLGIEPHRVAESLRLVHAQRLMRKLCLACREAVPLEAGERQALAITRQLLERLRLSFMDLDTVRVYRARGCPSCKDGYSNAPGLDARVSAVESLAISEDLREAIRRGAPGAELSRLAHAEGMWTLRESGLRRALLGETTLEEVVRVTPV